MGHAIVLALIGICGLLLPKKSKQQMMNQEAAEWLSERNTKG